MRPPETPFTKQGDVELCGLAWSKIAMKLPPSITWLQYTLANAAIVVLVPFLALQGMPPIDWAWSWASRPVDAAEEAEEADEDPEPVANWLAMKVSPVADATGISTAPWKMFSPKPDASNHRLRATIEYRDGTIVSWRSPQWPELSCWQRFWTSRELEYIDKISYNGPAERWFAFADYLAAQNRQNPQPEGAPKRVTFVVEEALIANPHIDGWQPMSRLIPRDNERVVTPKRVYSAPPELQKKQPAASTGAASP
jgi:hypothetical protein